MGLRSSVEELIERAGGCLVIDGGLATQLEALGADIYDPIWSARCLISDPDLIKQVHMQYLEAGADVLITSSYQASIPGFLTKGFSIKESELLLQRSVKLAREARDNFWNVVQGSPLINDSHPLVAASVGSYGAYLADGSEYSGLYGDVNLEKLKDFHRRRVQVLVDADPDILAFETIPNKLEAKLTRKLIAVYPNSGEVWDGRAKRWLPSECLGHEKFVVLAKRWKEAGASLIGGCCRTNLATIQAVSSVIKSRA